MAKSKTTAESYGAFIHVPGLDPKRYLVTVTVSRRDDEDMNAADLAAASKALPAAETVADVLASDPETAHLVAPKKGATKAKKVPAKKTTTPKRAAAKKPARGR